MPTAARRRLPLLVTLAIGVVFAVLAVWPQVIGAQRWQFVALAISFRAPLALGLRLLAVVAGIVALVRRRAAVALGLAIALGAAAVGNSAVLLARGVGGSTGEGDLTVAVWNTYGGSAPRRPSRGSSGRAGRTSSACPRPTRTRRPRSSASCVATVSR